MAELRQYLGRAATVISDIEISPGTMALPFFPLLTPTVWLATDNRESLFRFTFAW